MADSGGAPKRGERGAQSEAPSPAASLVPTKVVDAHVAAVAAAAAVPEAVPAATASTAPTTEKDDGAAVKIVSFAGLTRTLSTAEDGQSLPSSSRTSFGGRTLFVLPLTCALVGGSARAAPGKILRYGGAPFPRQPKVDVRAQGSVPLVLLVLFF